ncbi:uncharacterized protein MONOS_9296 [Monocercomonoides exilis]|uniref:uncharacterized protein n=1 Tax=Monocercomonoides exilis TaxID=2049356 RepID=UPI003559482A|nr:hypothetical protein MONOS_9296 [Monocercomonoides exilis]|eukprot:MONOS_9296.1-p1 / transcript=MONOS_9296.1 / gene=MONOS_9296 / organism=Monocercomonoides_exilis_PA203 / gene_product=unspecified product / transcript_product=unspecified product / location=Mono_scaffold00378:2492-4121(-) / protein_length=450 / sequence_SO=supercontig / SO=protein_coding / is_pseudo=false
MIRPFKSSLRPDFSQIKRDKDETMKRPHTANSVDSGSITLETVQNLPTRILFGDSFYKQLLQLEYQFNVNRCYNKSDRDILRVFSLFNVRKALTRNYLGEIKYTWDRNLFQKQLMDAAVIPHRFMDPELIELVTVGFCCSYDSGLYEGKSTTMFGKLFCRALLLKTSEHNWKIRMSLASLGLMFSSTFRWFKSSRFTLKETFALALERHKRKEIRLPGLTLICILYLSIKPIYLEFPTPDYKIAKEIKLDQHWLYEEALVRSMEDLNEAKEKVPNNFLHIDLCRFAVKSVFLCLLKYDLTFSDGMASYSDRFNHLLLQAIKENIVCLKELDLGLDFEGVGEGFESIIAPLLQRSRYFHIISFGKEGIKCIANYLRKLSTLNSYKANQQMRSIAYHLKDMTFDPSRSIKDCAILYKKYMEEEGFADAYVAIGSQSFFWNCFDRNLYTTLL